MAFSHTPVLLHEVWQLSEAARGAYIFDATVGLGGHAEMFLQKIGTRGKLIGCDADARNLRMARERLRQFKNVKLVHANFGTLADFVQPASLDFALFDLGVSSAHFDDPRRGFSFQNPGQLDMRFDTRQARTAASILNSETESRIAEILWRFGEIRSSRKIAAAIVRARKKQKFALTTDLTAIIKTKSLLPQVFQALRIAVNDELDSLDRGLSAAVQALRVGGRIAVISFHSLEDRIVKNFFRECTRACICPPNLLKCECTHSPFLKIITKKPVRPTAVEISENPRARSAKLRVAEKI